MIKLKIEGMTCGHCAAAVEKALSQVPNVDKITAVSFERGEAIIEGQADSNALIAAVMTEGYSAKLV